jgi:2-hydroxy-3-keto-5-methylthiopentenyl-1-phosphate phosphatase
MDVLPHDADLLVGAAAGFAVDRTLLDVVEAVDSVGGAIEVVSDGLGFHIAPVLEAIGLGRLPVATNLAVPGRGGEAVEFPFGHPRCHVCGTCKRERVRVHRAAERAVVFVGDGASDRYAAHHADVVFGKGALADYCEGEGLAYLPWRRLDDVARWIRAALADGRLPVDAAAFEPWSASYRSPERFICGPEVWGDDVREGSLLPVIGPPPD